MREEHMTKRSFEIFRTVVVNRSGILLLMVCGGLLAACNRRPTASPSGTLRADVLAMVGGQTILVAEYQAELERRARGRRSLHSGAKEELLEELVKSEAVYLRAKQAGFDQRPEIARQIKALVIQRFIEEQLKDNADTPLVSDAAVADYYRSQAARFATPPKVRFAVIQFRYSPKATEARKREVFETAAAVLAEASGSSFGALAQRHSEDQATRYGGGDAGWVSREESSRWPSPVIAAAFALDKAGDLSPVVTTSNACYLVKLIDRKTAGHKPLEEVAQAIRYELAVQNRHRTQDEFYKAAKADLKIEINHALLNSIPIPISQPISTPPALPRS